MKKATLLFLVLLSPLFADYDLENVSGWEIERRDFCPYHFEVNGDFVGDSKFTKDSVEGDHIRYGTLEVEFEVAGCYDSCRSEGFDVALSYKYSALDWDCNPFFDRRDFNTACVTLLAFTHRFCNWSWVGQFTYNIDANKWGFIDYSSYDWLAWGCYAWREDIGLHLGVYGQTGLRLPRILPVLGFDWRFHNFWKLSAVFPLNISLSYALDGCWSMALRGRWWSDRHRVGAHEHLSKAVWRYTNYGVELASSYLSGCLYADLHGGCAFGGNVKVAHRRGKHAHTLHFKPAAYFGGSIVAAF